MQLHFLNAPLFVPHSNHLQLVQKQIPVKLAVMHHFISIRQLCTHLCLYPTAALLLCYDPPVEVGRDGRPRRHYCMSHGKNFQQMFLGLLHDVQIQPADWHKTTHLPVAWGSFVERLFSSMLQVQIPVFIFILH